MLRTLNALLALSISACLASSAEVGVNGGKPRRSGFRVQMKQKRGANRRAADAQQAGGDVAPTVQCSVVLPAEAAGPIQCVAAHYASAARRRRPLPLQWPVLGELLALHPADGCSRVREMRVLKDGGARAAGDDEAEGEGEQEQEPGDGEGAAVSLRRKAVDVAVESGAERGALPLIALVARGGCDFATKVRRVQALNGAVARERREATRLERRRLKAGGLPVPARLGDGDEEERFAGVVLVDGVENERAGPAGDGLLLVPPGLGADASVWLPLVMVPHSNGTALRELLRGETEGLLDSAAVFSMEFKAG
jgi:hypothetical protein